MKRLLLAMLFAVPFAHAGGPFLDMSFGDALKKAEKEQKLVFVDFYATWCGPCKLLDRTTFKDKKVIQLLSEKAVALKIDAEIEVELAQKYEIQGYPSLLFIKPDGSVAQRLMGYHDANQFIGQAEATLTGKDYLTLLKEEVAQSGSAEQRANLLEALMQAGKPDEALAQAKILLPEYASSTDIPDEIGMRSIYMTGRIGDAGRQYLTEFAGQLRKQIVEGKPQEKTFGLFAFTNEITRNRDASLVLYEALRKEHGWTNERLSPFADVLMDQLMDSDQYTHLNELVNVDQRAKELWASMEAEMQGKNDEEAGDIQEQHIQQALGLYRLMVGLAEFDQANTLVDKVLALRDGAEIYNGLAWSGYLAQRRFERNLELAKMADKLSGGQDAAILDTLARVMGQNNQLKEAVELLESRKSAFTKGREAAMVDECLRDLKKQLAILEEQG